MLQSYLTKIADVVRTNIIDDDQMCSSFGLFSINY